jgi:hypothetical protein
VTGEDFREILRPLLLVYRVTFDAPSWLAYYRALEDVPARLLRVGVEHAMRTPREFLPRPGELREMAETVRLALVAAQPWQPCDDCRALHGWTEVQDADGVTRLQRCGCRAAHLARLEAEGVPPRTLIASGPARDLLEGETLQHQGASGSVQPGPKMLAALNELGGIAKSHRMPHAHVQTDQDGRPL